MAVSILVSVGDAQLIDSCCHVTYITGITSKYGHRAVTYPLFKDKVLQNSADTYVQSLLPLQTRDMPLAMVLQLSG